MRLRNEALDHFEPGRTSKYRGARLKFADFQLNRVFLSVPNVRRIRDDEIECGERQSR